ncbi:MAG: hypothetical protein H0V73_01595 [Chloroflexi bacterium]|nr:hypothetical protein [Chloroflexota bacterium]
MTATHTLRVHTPAKLKVTKATDAQKIVAIGALKGRPLGSPTTKSPLGPAKINAFPK